MSPSSGTEMPGIQAEAWAACICRPAGACGPRTLSLGLHTPACLLHTATDTTQACPLAPGSLRALAGGAATQALSWHPLPRPQSTAEPGQAPGWVLMARGKQDNKKNPSPASCRKAQRDLGARGGFQGWRACQRPVRDTAAGPGCVCRGRGAVPSAPLASPPRPGSQCVDNDTEVIAGVQVEGTEGGQNGSSGYKVYFSIL